MYEVCDSLGNCLRVFDTWQAAAEFKGLRYDWQIIPINK